MKSERYQDCYMKYDKESGVVYIGNKFIERELIFKKGHAYSGGITNKETGKLWKNKNSDQVMYFLGALDDEKYTIEIDTSVIQKKRNVSYMVVTIKLNLNNNQKGKITFKIYPERSLITSRIYVRGDELKKISDLSMEKETTGIEIGVQNQSKKDMKWIPDTLDSVNFEASHIKLTNYKLLDQTDRNNTLMKKEEEYVYYKSNPKDLRKNGNVLLVDSYLEEEGLLLVKEAPSEFAALNQEEQDFLITPGEKIFVTGSSINMDSRHIEEWVPCYEVTIGIGHPAHLLKCYKELQHYMNGAVREKNFTMSNTWGDRNQDKCVNEAFMIAEIDTASELGIDIAQIDDGWQSGITANSALQKGGVWEGYHETNPHFWKVNKDKFPRGLEYIVEYGRVRNVKIGLWFSPDSSKDFENWKKDGDILLGLFRTYGITYFKLDGIKVRNKSSEMNLMKLFRYVDEASVQGITFLQDITAEKRFGYLYEKEYGTLFVENRYSDWGSYYPHYTLRNIWQLADIIPTQRLQMELLNNRRNQEVYGDDPLAPHQYDIDYLFAITMVSNPLFWMELSNLTLEDKRKLKDVIKIYDGIRGDIHKSEVNPIGDIPDGTAFTGFHIKTSPTRGYMLFFKELTKKNEYSYYVEELANQRIEYRVIMGEDPFKSSNQRWSLGADGEIRVQINGSRSYHLISYDLK